jgi:hypothetical protein
MVGNLSGNLIAAAFTAAVTKAAPNYMPLAYHANAKAFQPACTEIPTGPCHELYKKDEYYNVFESLSCNVYLAQSGVSGWAQVSKRIL